MVVKHLRNDSIHITNYVIALIVAEVIKEIPAIQLTTGTFRDEIMNAVHKKYAAKGIYVSSESSIVDIKVMIAIEYGENIARESYYMQKSIKKQVEQITGLHVKTVEVFVEKVFFNG